jgi:hypothetical protein
MKVLFGADGRCPTCHVERDAPVTDAHRARAAEIRADVESRPPLPDPAEDRVTMTRGDALVSLLFGAAAVFIGVTLTVVSVDGPRPTIWYGLIFVGLLAAGRGALGLVAGARGGPSS